MAWMPPPLSAPPPDSKPPTSSPCQQCKEIGIVSSLFKAASVSTPQEAYTSLAQVYCSLLISSGWVRCIPAAYERRDPRRSQTLLDSLRS